MVYLPSFTRLPFLTRVRLNTLPMGIHPFLSASTARLWHWRRYSEIVRPRLPVPDDVAFAASRLRPP